MFGHRVISGLCAILLLCSALSSVAQTQGRGRQNDEVPWDVLDGGGGQMYSPNYSVGGSLGQIVSGVSTTETWMVSAGYWAGIDSLPRGVCLCGDCNGDGRVTVADATYIVSYIYRGGAGMICECDVNLDGRISIADATYIIGYIYRGGFPPCEPPVGAPFREKRKEK